MSCTWSLQILRLPGPFCVKTHNLPLKSFNLEKNLNKSVRYYGCSETRANLLYKQAGKLKSRSIKR